MEPGPDSRFCCLFVCFCFVVVVVVLGGRGQNLDAFPLQEGHIELDFVGFTRLWGSFFQAQLMTTHF